MKDMDTDITESNLFVCMVQVRIVSNCDVAFALALNPQVKSTFEKKNFFWSMSIVSLQPSCRLLQNVYFLAWPTEKCHLDLHNLAPFVYVSSNAYFLRVNRWIITHFYILRDGIPEYGYNFVLIIRYQFDAVWNLEKYNKELVQYSENIPC